MLHLLGLARRAGAIVPGTDAVRSAVRDGSARFVLLAEDTAEGQRKKLEPLMMHRGVPHRTWGLRDELGGAVGLGRVSALALTDPSFAGQVADRLGDESGHS